MSSTPEGFADSADIAEAPPPPPDGPLGGFADIADIALEREKYTLNLKNRTPVNYPYGGSSPGVPPLTHHNSGLRAKSAISAKLLQPGWLVAYRDSDGRLRGGADERYAGTVAACDDAFVTLTTGERVALGCVVGVSRISRTGAIAAAWVVARHGLDGTKEAVG